MARTVLATPSAPAAMGPYNVAVEANGFIFLSGQVALKPEGGRAEDDVEAQTRQIMENISRILADLGHGLSDVAKTTIFMADINDYATVNAVYAGYFEDATAPARSAVEVANLPGGFLVEIEMIVARR